MKTRMLKRLTGPDAMSATALSKETGIAQGTLSRWLRRAGTVGGVSTKKRKRTRASSPSRRAQDWTAKEKLAVVMEAETVPQEELGAFLRRKGLYREQLEQWREAAAQALEESPGRRKRGRRGLTPEQKRIRELERQLRRKEKALAEAAALLVLKKKFEAVFGDEEDDTDPRSDG
jgi:transposase-like protein